MNGPSEHITNALRALTPHDGTGGRTQPTQATIATAYAEIAKAQAAERIANALDAIAAALITNTVTTGATIQRPIGHSA